MAAIGEVLDDELHKMKVSELKDMLKSYGLTPLGRKAELIKQLQDYLAENPESFQVEQAEAELEADLEEEEAEAAAKSPAAAAASAQGEAGTPSELPSSPGAAATTPAVPGAKIRIPVKAPPVKTGEAITSLTDEQKLELRKSRFGGGGTNAASNGDVLKKRAERFGLATSGTPVQLEKLQSRSERFKAVTSPLLAKEVDKERIEKRKARFGEITAPGAQSSSASSATTDKDLAEKLKVRAARFGVVSDNAKLELRKERFGGGGGGSAASEASTKIKLPKSGSSGGPGLPKSVSSGGPGLKRLSGDGSGAADDEKKKKRAERFNLISA